MGQKRSRAGQGKWRAGHFPRSDTKQRLESRLGLIVGQPRRNAPFLTHGERWIPYGGMLGGTRGELNGRDSLLAPRPPMDKRDIHLARPGCRAAVAKMADRCTRYGA